MTWSTRYWDHGGETSFIERMGVLRLEKWLCTCGYSLIGQLQTRVIWTVIVWVIRPVVGPYIGGKVHIVLLTLTDHTFMEGDLDRGEGIVMGLWQPNSILIRGQVWNVKVNSLGGRAGC